ncbi:MAG: hypothetical protein MI974_26310 [Chitinophagales bacterium]|nr:hypothetical protein [Chitinophagales bacterium]
MYKIYPTIRNAAIIAFCYCDLAEALQDDDKGQHLGLHLILSSPREAGTDIWVGNRPGGGARFIVAYP